MSRTNKGKKAPGYDYWSKRNHPKGISPGKKSKRITNKAERKAAKKYIDKDLEVVPLVECAFKWRMMDGDGELEKRLNSYLTTQFILSHDVPSDECLYAAKEIIRIVDTVRGRVNK